MLCFGYYVLPNGTFSDTEREKMALRIKQEGNDKISSWRNSISTSQKEYLATYLGVVKPE